MTAEFDFWGISFLTVFKGISLTMQMVVVVAIHT